SRGEQTEELEQLRAWATTLKAHRERNGGGDSAFKVGSAILEALENPETNSKLIARFRVAQQFSDPYKIWMAFQMFDEAQEKILEKEQDYRVIRQFLSPRVQQIRFISQYSANIDVFRYLDDRKGWRYILIDTGDVLYARSIPVMLEREGISLKKVEAIYLTHSHPDHAGNAYQLAKLSGAPVRIHPNFSGVAQNHADRHLFDLVLGLDYQAIHSVYQPLKYSENPKERIIHGQAFRKFESLLIGDLEIEILNHLEEGGTHAADAILFFLNPQLERNRKAFSTSPFLFEASLGTGDLFLNEGVVMPPIYQQLFEWRRWRRDGVGPGGGYAEQDLEVKAAFREHLDLLTWGGHGGSFISSRIFPSLVHLEEYLKFQDASKMPLSEWERAFPNIQMELFQKAILAWRECERVQFNFAASLFNRLDQLMRARMPQLWQKGELWFLRSIFPLLIPLNRPLNRLIEIMGYHDQVNLDYAAKMLVSIDDQLERKLEYVKTQFIWMEQRVSSMKEGEEYGQFPALEKILTDRQYQIGLIEAQRRNLRQHLQALAKDQQSDGTLRIFAMRTLGRLGGGEDHASDTT
ncbi:MAG: MBL fold metallo-hydrolase, partial [Candidatus Tectomicrobia bacterium]|nr:MBL fold metallo-hydrolase [Candidatus Tectomicrobia bacterium]